MLNTRSDRRLAALRILYSHTSALKRFDGRVCSLRNVLSLRRDGSLVDVQTLKLQLKGSTADPLELERALTTGDTDHRVLRDFRDAVDRVRKAA